MSLRRWSRPLLAALVLAGCKSEKTPAPPAQDPSTPAPTAAPAKAPAPTPAPAPAPAPTLTPAAGPAVSYLRPADPERCEWVRQPLPSGEPVPLFAFNAACDRAMVSWSPDAKEGLVFSWPSGQGEEPKAWRVDLAGKTGKAIDLKTLPGGVGAGDQDKPSIQQLAFDKQGRVVAIVSDVYVARKTQEGKDGKRALMFEGKSYPLDDVMEGIPGLAHAYRLEEGTWKRIETKASSFEADLALGIDVLDTLKTLQPVANASVSSVRAPGKEAPEAAAEKLNAAFPGQDEEGQWMEVSTAGGPVFYRAVLGGEYLYPSVPLAWEQGGKLVELEGLLAKKDDFLGLQTQDAWLLIANYGDPRSAQLWDTKTQERILSVEGANAPTFWPKPGGP